MSASQQDFSEGTASTAPEAENIQLNAVQPAFTSGLHQNTSLMLNPVALATETISSSPADAWALTKPREMQPNQHAFQSLSHKRQHSRVPSVSFVHNALPHGEQTLCDLSAEDEEDLHISIVGGDGNDYTGAAAGHTLSTTIAARNSPSPKRQVPQASHQAHQQLPQPGAPQPVAAGGTRQSLSISHKLEATTPRLPGSRASSRLSQTTPMQAQTQSRRQTGVAFGSATPLKRAATESSAQAMAAASGVPGSTTAAMTITAATTLSSNPDTDVAALHAAQPGLASRRNSQTTQPDPNLSSTYNTPRKVRGVPAASPYAPRSSHSVRKRESMTSTLSATMNSGLLGHRRLPSSTSVPSIVAPPPPPPPTAESKSDELWNKLRHCSNELSRLHRTYLETISKIEDLHQDSSQITEKLSAEAHSKFEQIREHVLALHPVLALLSAADSSASFNWSASGASGPSNSTQHEANELASGVAKYFDIKHVPLPVVTAVPNAATHSSDLGIALNSASFPPPSASKHARRPTATMFCEAFGANPATILNPSSVSMNDMTGLAQVSAASTQSSTHEKHDIGSAAPSQQGTPRMHEKLTEASRELLKERSPGSLPQTTSTTASQARNANTQPSDKHDTDADVQEAVRQLNFDDIVLPARTASCNSDSSLNNSLYREKPRSSQGSQAMESNGEVTSAASDEALEQTAASTGSISGGSSAEARDSNKPLGFNHSTSIITDLPTHSGTTHHASADAVFSKIFSESVRSTVVSGRQSIVTVNGIVELLRPNVAETAAQADQTAACTHLSATSSAAVTSDANASPVRKPNAPESGKLSALRKQHRAAFLGQAQTLGQQIPATLTNLAPACKPINHSTLVRKGLFPPPKLESTSVASQGSSRQSALPAEVKSKISGELAALLSEFTIREGSAPRSSVVASHLSHANHRGENNSSKVSDLADAILDMLVREGLIGSSDNDSSTRQDATQPIGSKVVQAKASASTSTTAKQCRRATATAVEAMASLVLLDADDGDLPDITFAASLSDEEESDPAPPSSTALTDTTKDRRSIHPLLNRDSSLKATARALSSWQEVFAEEQARALKQQSLINSVMRVETNQAKPTKTSIAPTSAGKPASAPRSQTALGNSSTGPLTTQAVRKPTNAVNSLNTPKRPTAPALNVASASRMAQKAIPPSTKTKLDAKTQASGIASMPRGRPSLSRQGLCHVAHDNKSVVYVTPNGQRVKGALVFVLDDTGAAQNKEGSQDAPQSLLNSSTSVTSSSIAASATNEPHIALADSDEKSSVSVTSSTEPMVMKPIPLAVEVIDATPECDTVTIESAPQDKLRTGVPMGSSPALGPNTGFYIRQDDGSLVPVVPDQLQIETLGITIEDDMVELDKIQEGDEEDADDDDDDQSGSSAQKCESPTSAVERVGNVDMLADVTEITPRNADGARKLPKSKRTKQGRASLMVQRLSVGGGVCPMLLCTASGAPISTDQSEFVAEAMVQVLQSKGSTLASDANSKVDGVHNSPARSISIQGTEVRVQPLSVNVLDVADELFEAEVPETALLTGEDAARAAAVARGPLADSYSDTEDEDVVESEVKSGPKKFKARPKYFHPWRLDACLSETPYLEQVISIEADSAMKLIQVAQEHQASEEAAVQHIDMEVQFENATCVAPETIDQEQATSPEEMAEAAEQDHSMPSPTRLLESALRLHSPSLAQTSNMCTHDAVLKRMTSVLYGLAHPAPDKAKGASRLAWDTGMAHDGDNDSDDSEDEGNLVDSDDWPVGYSGNDPISLLDWTSFAGQKVSTENIDMLSPLKPQAPDQGERSTSSAEGADRLELPTLAPSHANPQSPIPTLGWIERGIPRDEYDAQNGLDSATRDLQNGALAGALLKRNRQERGIQDMPFAPASRSALMGARIGLPGPVAEAERALLAHWLTLLMKKCSSLAWQVRAAKPLSKQVAAALSNPLPIYTLVTNRRSGSMLPMEASISLLMDPSPSVKVDLLCDKSKTFLFPLSLLLTIDVATLKETTDEQRLELAMAGLHNGSVGNELTVTLRPETQVQRLLSRSLTFSFESKSSYSNPDLEYQVGQHEGEESDGEESDNSLLVDLGNSSLSADLAGADALDGSTRAVGVRIIFASKLLAKIWSCAVYLF